MTPDIFAYRFGAYRKYHSYNIRGFWRATKMESAIDIFELIIMDFFVADVRRSSVYAGQRI